MTLLIGFVQLLHVFTAMLWVGGAFFFEVVVTKLRRGQALESHRQAARTIMPHLGPFFGVVGGLTVVFGIVRGFVGGRLSTLGAFATPYGIAWIVVLVLSVVMAVWGARVIAPATHAVYDDDALWVASPDEGPTDALVRASKRLSWIAHTETAGFLVIIAIMIAMALVL